MGKRSQSSYSYGKGRRSVADTPGGSYGEKWYQKLEYLDNPKKGKPKEIRLVGGLFTIFQHFVRFKRKDGSKGGFYEVCPNWDWEKGEFLRGPDAVCPLCADFQNEDLPQDLRMLGSFRYYTDAFDITAAKGGYPDVFGVLFTNKYGKNDLASISDIAGSSVDDLENGSSVIWNYDEKASDAKDKTRFYQGKPLPVEWDGDRQLFVLKNKFVGKPTDFAEIIDIREAAEIRSDLKRIGLYARLEEALEALGNHSRYSESRSKSGGGSWDDEEESKPSRRPRRSKPADESGADDEPASGPRKGTVTKKAPNKPAQTSDAEADDDWGDDVDARTEAGAASDDWGDDAVTDVSDPNDDDWGDDVGADWDDDPKPPKRSAAKSTGKQAPKSKPAADDDDPDSW